MSKGSEPKAQETGVYVKIATIGNLIEAQIIESVLNERAIIHRLRSFHDTAYDGLFQLQKGWGEIYAPAENREVILEILESTRQGYSEESDPGT